MRWLALVAVLMFAVVGCESSTESSDNGVVGDLGTNDVFDNGVEDIGGEDTAGDAAGVDVAGVDAVEDGFVGDTQVEDTAIEDTPAEQDVIEDVVGDLGIADIGEMDVLELPEVQIEYPARALPFEYTRPAEGEDIPAGDVTAFTQKVAKAYKDIGFFRWLLRTSTGVDHTTETDDYLAWHNDIRAIKTGDTVLFDHRGGEHNMWIPGSAVLSSVMNAYLMTGEWEMARLTEQYCKGLTAVVKGFVWDENDPAPNLMARAVFPMDHDFSLDEDFWHDDGRKKAIKFSTMYHAEDGWNAHTFEWPHNPTWGYSWVTNMRSKDDVRAISRTTTFLHYVVEDAEDDWVKAACQETLDTMKAFHKDIVDSGYNIRTKDSSGNAYVIPCDDQDLGSYMCYYELDPRNECCARLSADLIAYGERLTNECGTCTGSIYDMFASAAHFYNYPIVWDYHMAALGMALVHGKVADAYRLMVGLDERIDSYMHPSADEPGVDDHAWFRDISALLVQAASMGLPLTADEARLVQQHWSYSAEHFSAWTYWDLWDASIPDGEYVVRPTNPDEGVELEMFAILFEYCNSPFKNPAGVQFVDCDILAEPSNW